MRLKLTVEYDGTGFRGWARQPGVRTVEGDLLRALGGLYGSVDGPAVAGRTDTGVHALANVVSVEVEGGPPPDRAAEALNAALPEDVAVVRSEQAADDFHAVVRETAAPGDCILIMGARDPSLGAFARSVAESAQVGATPHQAG